ncbi:[citrate (pro-3S)-lyase] ligase [Cronobacter sakazakii]|uniref:[citrate (pro-3S)-lyase] ligase n=1 Tax=Cronobacter sakazakii TaxID=28141 RepID=UPI000A18D452|nr:[citrate (pro-3S)-lyase] ligase [Cronobacter sakazakii]EME1772310.1 [citrate (pro-3S)-lyase] ligase [Cronobacter sakazakii]EME1814784.1 [citrate (pro-3S)-lyase] ligase [Cronobacter sakazakii]PUY84319.1 [citrate (pro-3S)-lyase] ligase [Cronobacter sakazakii]PUZ00336.1 [citrate (pro-3S)-lyase] ligase [Cronobacter sakazakii]
MSNLELITVALARQPQEKARVAAFLASNQLGMDEDVTHVVIAIAQGEIAGCAGLAGNVIKGVAVDERWRGENLSARLLVEVENLAMSLGHFHLFLCTRPYNLERFRRCGFWPLAQCDDIAALLENTPSGIRRYCQQLGRLKQPGARIGAVVMNANPFTLGHRFLAEQAASVSDWLHLFVVREDASFFPYRERLAMVRAGVAHLPNVTVHEGSAYLISRATFPGYFLKERGLVDKAWSGLDLQIFRRYIAPALGINQRFVGSEPFCPVTRAYNQAMHTWLEHAPLNAPPVSVIEIPRLSHAEGEAISASEVRRLLRAQRFSSIRERVPESTYALLAQRYRAEVA